MKEHKCESKNCGRNCNENSVQSGCTSNETSSSLRFGCGKEKKKTMTIDVKGDKVDCNVIDVFEIDECQYIALINKDTDRLYMYKYSEINDEVILEDIIDNEELRLVGKVVIELLD